MKRLKYLLIIFILLGKVANAQVFHFVNTHTVLIKDITQSPVHWYLEIYNDLNIEDTLRWKAHFVNCPPQWDINFDTQSGYWYPVLDGDSADFELMDSLDFPQKLIIGNATNLTPGHGSVFFDIYDPQNPTNLVTIEFEFIITPVGAGVEDEDLEIPFKILGDQIEFYGKRGLDYSIVSSIGQVMQQGNSQNGTCTLSGFSPGIYYLWVDLGKKQVVRKFIY
jgi:hypothetical protein